MQLLHVIEAEDFCLEMDEALIACGHKLFDINSASAQDYLEFPMTLDVEYSKELSPNELDGYLTLRSHITYLLLESLDEEYMDVPDMVLLQNYLEG